MPSTDKALKQKLASMGKGICWSKLQANTSPPIKGVTASATVSEHSTSFLYSGESCSLPTATRIITEVAERPTFTAAAMPESRTVTKIQTITDSFLGLCSSAAGTHDAQRESTTKMPTATRNARSGAWRGSVLRRRGVNDLSMSMTHPTKPNTSAASTGSNPSPPLLGWLNIHSGTTVSKVRCTKHQLMCSTSKSTTRRRWLPEGAFL
mmetsp:Transcript_2252/g.4043  ORF Transcript_2252/g.4043 Transcript_2252/m.4043 type:complete len:208 (-) Transcript_2252:45-668(-)